MGLNRHLANLFFGFTALPVFADPRVDISALKNNILTEGSSFADLRELTQSIGPRLTGSGGASQAVDWAVAKLRAYQLDRVYRQPVIVPHWERGSQETAYIIGTHGKTNLNVTALGRSAGANGLEAEVLEVQNLGQVRTLGEAVRGKIVFFNRAMNPNLQDPFEAYGQAVDQRSKGPSLAASYGAAAVLVRSMTTLADDDHPHTGATSFKDGIAPIPAAALSTHAANILSQQLAKDRSLKVHLELSARNLPDLTSYNVIGEITGRERPDEIVLVGGHLDSWDLAQGAHDDGAGVTQSMDVCRAIKSLGIHPRRTIRCVLFMTEELGGIGGEEYAKQAAMNHERHIMALESDRGGFAPQKFSVDGSTSEIEGINSWLSDFTDLGIHQIYQGGAGTDVEPLKELGALTMEVIPDPTHYFDYHHAATDTFEAVDEIELKKGAAALATMIYRFSEMP